MKPIQITYQCDDPSRATRYIIVDGQHIGRIRRNAAVKYGESDAFSVLMDDGFTSTSSTLKGAKSIVAKHLEK